MMTGDRADDVEVDVQSIITALKCMMIVIAAVFLIIHALVFIVGPQQADAYTSNMKNEQWIVEDIGVCVPRRQGTCSYLIRNGGRTLYLESSNAYYVGQSLYRSTWNGPLGGSYLKWGKHPLIAKGRPSFFVFF